MDKSLDIGNTSPSPKGFEKLEGYDICQSQVVATRINEDGKQVRVVRLKKKKKKRITKNEDQFQKQINQISEQLKNTEKTIDQANFEIEDL